MKKISMCVITIVLGVALACSRQSTTPASPVAPSAGSLAETADADGSTLKASAPVATAPVNDAQVSTAPTLTASTAKLSFSTLAATLRYRFQLFNEAGTMVQDSGLLSVPSFAVSVSLELKKRYTWRVRAEFEGAVGPWSALASFISPEGGYIRGSEVFDPLYNGATVGERIGPTTFIPGQGIRLETAQSFVRYTIPTLTAGEFSMEITGLRANNVGDKSKVFAMSSNGPDFITDPYRADVQYRGVQGFPPNAITFRVLYGDGDDLSKRYEPDTGTRLASVYNLDPATTYFWRLAWGSEVRVTVRVGSSTGPILYNIGLIARNGSYSPVPHYLYLGSPTGRSGVESASVPGSTFKNVWISSRARPF